MRRLATGIALAALLVPCLPGMAPAQEEGAVATECTEFDGYRNFTGKVDRISKRDLIVDNRQGDKLKFKKAEEVVVQGKKDKWSRVKKADWVIVAWKMADNPRVAYKVCVRPEQQEAGDVLD